MRRDASNTLRTGILAILAAAALTLSTPALASGSAEPSGNDDGGQPTSITLGEAVGPEVSGGDSLAAATATEAGLSQTVLARGESGNGNNDGTVAYFKLPKLEAGERTLVSAQLMVDTYREPTSSASAGIEGRLYAATGESCSSGESARVSRSSFDRLPAIALRSEIFDPERGYGCHEDQTGETYLELKRTGEWQDEDPMPVQLRITVEPAIDPTTLGEADTNDLPPAAVSLTGEATPLAGGSSFTTAAPIESGSVIADAVLPYEMKFYKVAVEEGQRLNYRLAVENNADASARSIVAQTYNPVLEHDFMLYGANSLRRDDVSEFITRNMAVSVTRDLHDEYFKEPLRVAGDYYIVILGDANDPRGLRPFEYEIAVEVTGEAKESLDWAKAAQSDSAKAAGVDPATGQASERSGFFSWLPTGAQVGAFVGGLALALVLAIGAWILRRSMRAKKAAPAQQGPAGQPPYPGQPYQGQAPPQPQQPPAQGSFDPWSQPPKNSGPGPDEQQRGG
ncbi:hypothetical protein BJH93_02705 [Kocuria polaris]|nr:hypothetical protein [Kocuria polaris]